MRDRFVAKYINFECSTYIFVFKYLIYNNNKSNKSFDQREDYLDNIFYNRKIFYDLRYYFNI